MEFDPNPTGESYLRLGRLVGDLDHVLAEHMRKHDIKLGVNDAFNAVLAVLAGVVESVADYDYDVFNILPGAISYHIYHQAACSDERGMYKTSVERKVR